MEVLEAGATVKISLPSFVPTIVNVRVSVVPPAVLPLNDLATVPAETDPPFVEAATLRAKSDA